MDGCISICTKMVNKHTGTVTQAPINIAQWHHGRGTITPPNFSLLKNLFLVNTLC